MRKLRRWGAILSLIAVSGTLGGHWLALQMVAWGQMLVAYSAQSDIAIAIQDTFSGKKPCKMCHRISREQQKENRSPSYLSSLSFDVFVAPDSDGLRLEPIPCLSRVIPRTVRAISWTSPPPTPPPRAV